MKIIRLPQTPVLNQRPPGGVTAYFSCLIVSQGASQARKAAEVCQRIEWEKNAFNYATRKVEIGELHGGRGAQVAAAEAAMADVIIVALDWGAGVPLEFADWCLTWSDRRPVPGGTLVLLGEPAPDAALWREFFQHTAGRGDMELWYRWDGYSNLISDLGRRVLGYGTGLGVSPGRAEALQPAPGPVDGVATAYGQEQVRSA